MGSVQCQIVPRSNLDLFSSSMVAPQMHSLIINCRDLICYTCHFQSIFPFFVYFCFLCLQVSSVSNFPWHKGVKEATHLGSLLQLYCGEGGTPQTNSAGIYGECSPWMGHTGFARGPRVTSRVHTAKASGCSARALSQVGAACRALPRSKPLRFSGPPQGRRPRWTVCFVPFPGPSSQSDRVLGECTVPGGPCVLCTSLVPASQCPRCAFRAQFQACHVSPLGSWPQAVTLLTDVNRPRSQEDVVINGEPAHGLVEDAVSGAKIAAAPCLVVLAIAQLPLCLCGGRALYGSCLALLCYLINPLFCEHARGHRMELEPLVGKGFCFCFFVSLAIPRFGLLSHISSLRLPSGNSGPAPTRCWWMQTSVSLLL